MTNRVVVPTRQAGNGFRGPLKGLQIRDLSARRCVCVADVLEYEPDADMIFNYLMVSALASATDYIERNNIKPTGGQLTHLFNY
jgi:hypothetical protein